MHSHMGIADPPQAPPACVPVSMSRENGHTIRVVCRPVALIGHSLLPMMHRFTLSRTTVVRLADLDRPAFSQ